MGKITRPLKYHGGQHYSASTIVGLFPPRCKNPNAPGKDDPGYLHYVEPYFGGGAVLFENDPEGISEVINDIDFLLMNFWTCLIGQGFEAFAQMCQVTPLDKTLFLSACDFIAKLRQAGKQFLIQADVRQKLQAAHAFFVVARQCMAGRTRKPNFTPLVRTRTRRGMNDNVSSWLSAVDGLPEVRNRLIRVVHFCDDAEKVIVAEDGQRTLFYLDPPFLAETRTAQNVYEYEMDREAHVRLLALLKGIKGRFVLSGYRSALYDECAKANGWRRVDWELPNSSASGDEKRIMLASAWMNY